MAYTNAQSANRRFAILGTVATVHLLAGYALVTGLAARFVPETITILRGEHIPAPKPTPTQQPERPKADQKMERDQQVIALPVQQRLPPTPQGPVQFADSGGGTATGGGIGEVEFPLIPPPQPPAFTLRGPRPSGSEARWVTANDYPSNDLRMEHEGLTRVRLTVTDSGKVARCDVTSSSGWPGLDKAACDRLTRRAAFTPATDHNGARVEGSYSTAVRWRIPAE